MNTIKNPWDKEFYGLVKSCNESLKISSPYVKVDIINDLYKNIVSNVSFTLITSFKLMNFYKRSSDIEAIENIIDRKGKVKNYQNLHSKIYIFDDVKCIITSANLTNGGLKNNYEYGLYVDDKKILREIIKDFKYINENPLTGVISKEEVNTVKNILSSVPKEKPIKLPKITLKTQQDVSDIYTGGIDTIVSNLEGWKIDVFKCLLEIRDSIFTLKQVNKFEYRLKKLHPENRFIQPKIRQQLQVLRDIGLLEFVKRGVYRKLWE